MPRNTIPPLVETLWRAIIGPAVESEEPSLEEVNTENPDPPITSPPQDRDEPTNDLAATDDTDEIVMPAIEVVLDIRRFEPAETD